LVEYKEWLNMACELGQSKVGLAIRMTNPAKIAQQAEMEDLFAAQAIRDEAAWVASSKQKAPNAPGDSEEEESDKLNPTEWDSINLHMKHIYATHLVNMAYNRHTPVFIDPQNHNQYILLTVTAFSKWAKALVCHVIIPTLMCNYLTDLILLSQVERKDDIRLKSPPNLLRFLRISAAKQSRLSNELDASALTASTSVVNESNLQLISKLLASRNTLYTKRPSINSEEAPNTAMSSPPNKTNINFYIDFLGIRNREYTLELLLANGFHSHKVFKSTTLSCSKVKEIGLTLGVVTMLFENVAKYD
jgi:hypothetical protein